jgi:hypothetical protein
MRTSSRVPSTWVKGSQVPGRDCRHGNQAEEIKQCREGTCFAEMTMPDVPDMAYIQG